MSTWRVGGKVPLNVYEDGRPMFQLDWLENIPVEIGKYRESECMGDYYELVSKKELVRVGKPLRSVIDAARAAQGEVKK